MSKWYEVEIVAYQTVLVEVADDPDTDPEDEAWDLARSESAFSFCDNVEMENIRLLNTPQEIDSVRRHADVVSPLPEEK